MKIYYNDNDKKNCAWLRELIKCGLIPAGDVDDRSITDVKASDLADYTSCHFFAGIGGWAYALRLADWPDDRPVWTGSCPCQPFSQAGKGKVDKDERHLWPAFRTLIAQCRPTVCFGEQVASADGRIWLAGVRTDLEGVEYAVGAADLCAAGVGAPNIRQRLYWVADANCRRLNSRSGETSKTPELESRDGEPKQRSSPSGLAHSERPERRPIDNTCGDEGRNCLLQREKSSGRPGSDSETGRLVQSNCSGRIEGQSTATPTRYGHTIEPTGNSCGMGDSKSDRSEMRTPLHGEVRGKRSAEGCQPSAWDSFDIIPCADGKSRRVESGTFPLAHGVSGRVGLLRGYGNAIVPQVAAEFIRAYLEL